MTIAGNGCKGYFAVRCQGFFPRRTRHHRLHRPARHVAQLPRTGAVVLPLRGPGCALSAGAIAPELGLEVLIALRGAMVLQLVLPGRTRHHQRRRRARHAHISSAEDPAQVATIALQQHGLAVAWNMAPFLLPQRHIGFRQLVKTRLQLTSVMSPFQASLYKPGHSSTVGPSVTLVPFMSILNCFVPCFDGIARSDSWR